MSGNSQRFHCPHCQAELSLPAGATAGTGKRRWRVRLAIVGVFLLGCVWLAYRYKGQFITVLDLTTEVTGSSALSLAALVLAAFAALSVAGWLLLPFLLVWACLGLRRRLGSPPPCQILASAPRSDPVTPSTPPSAPPAA